MHEGWRRADELLSKALDLAADQRGAFLERECAGDATLRERVERLLILADSRGAWLPTGGGFGPSDALPVQIGQTIATYTVLAEIGAGGMGVVYRAHDAKLGRDVVLKTLPTSLASDLDALSRLKREARILASLQHPRIATVFGLEETETQTFVVMELLQGDDLARRLENGPFPVAEALSILSQIADALEAAHESSIIHRDLKPSNVILSPRDRVKVLDFGVAKAMRDEDGTDLDDESAFGRTPDGRMIGTPAYASPEQLRGHELDARSDLFSLGVLAYELVTGQHPFRRDSFAETLSAILNEDLPPFSATLSDVPVGLERLVGRLLAKAPADRFESASEVRAEIESLRQGSLPAAAPASPVVSARRASDRHDWSVAFQTLKEADGHEDLAAEDLERLGEAAYWTARIQDALDAWERAHLEYVRADQPEGAARVAMLIAEENINMTATSVANGWIRRAETLLGERDSVGHGYLARLRTRIAFEADGDLDAAFAFTELAQAVAEEYEDLDLRALALQDRGRIHIARDEHDVGMALIEEAMSSALGGGLAPNTVGKTYCNMITACEKLADYRRVGEWIDRATRWCQLHTDSAYPGICAVHHAEVMYERGSWPEAERLAQRAAKDHSKWAIPVAAGAFYVLGEIQLRWGAFEEAEAAFTRGHELGRDPVPGLALLRLAQGDVRAAQSLIARPLKNEDATELQRAILLPAAVEIALAAGDTEAAHGFVSELKEIAKRHDSPVFGARKAQARGATHLAEGKLDVALSCLQQACSLWKKADVPYHEARSRALLAEGYAKDGDVEHARLEARTARSVFEKLRAPVDLRGLEEKLGEIL